MNIEPLESRIAPAKLLSLIDVDGDLITITTSKGTDAELEAVVGTSILAGAVAGGVAIGTINLAGNAAAFDGTSISITAKRGPLGGDGLVNVGSINAVGLDLGSVTVKGDLSELDAGKNTATSKVRAINVYSATGSPVWNLQCSVGSLTVKTNVITTEINVTGASLGKLTIGGSLVGTDGVAASGYIHLDNGTLGTVVIGGSIIGAVEDNSGQLKAKSITSVTVGGSLLGGGGNGSGRIDSFDGALGPVIIKGDVRGGSGASSGSVEAESITSLTVGGSLIGGSGNRAGHVFVTTAVGTLGTLVIKGDLVGGQVGESGLIQSNGELGAVTIGGSVIAGSASGTGIIQGFDGVGKVKIGHDLAGGNISSNSGGIAGVTIGGSVFGGTDEGSGAVSAGGDIGPIRIGGDLVAGPASSGGAFPKDTGLIHADKGGSPTDVANIASITIGGSVIGRGGMTFAQIYSDGAIGPVKIGGDLLGGSGASSGRIVAGQSLGLVTIGGSVIGGIRTSAASLAEDSGSIYAGGKLAGVKIGGSLIGGTGTASGAIASAIGIGSISIGGDFIGSAFALGGTITSGGTLGAITIGGSVRPGGGDGSARISAGNDAMLALGTNLLLKSVTVAGSATKFVVEGTRPDGVLGPVKVGGDWTRGRITSGIDRGAGGEYGDGDDVASGIGDPDLFSTIASIKIGGAVIGTPTSVDASDHFGFVAQHIRALSIGGTKIPLLPKNGDDINASLSRYIISATRDFTVHEVA